MGKIAGGKQDYFGPTYTSDRLDGAVKEFSESQPAPPENGVPPAA
jgi:hypothetical protein